MLKPLEEKQYLIFTLCSHKETNIYGSRTNYLLGVSIIYMAALFWYFHAQKSAMLCQTLWTAKAFFPSELSTYSVCLQLHKSEVLKLPIVIWYFFQKENTNPQKRVIIKYSPI